MEHFEQCKCDECPFRNLPSGGSTGPVDGSAGVGSVEKGLVDKEVVDARERVELVLSVLEWRDLRRKGIDGTRNVGKTDGTACGSDGLRRKDIFCRCWAAGDDSRVFTPFVSTSNGEIALPTSKWK